MELRLASTYTESKANLLNDVLEEFFFDDGSFWEAAPLPSGVRDVTYELINTMVTLLRLHPLQLRPLLFTLLHTEQAWLVKEIFRLI